MVRVVASNEKTFELTDIRDTHLLERTEVDPIHLPLLETDLDGVGGLLGEGKQLWKKDERTTRQDRRQDQRKSSSAHLCQHRINDNPNGPRVDSIVVSNSSGMKNDLRETERQVSSRKGRKEERTKTSSPPAPLFREEIDGRSVPRSQRARDKNEDSQYCGVPTIDLRLKKETRWSASNQTEKQHERAQLTRFHCCRTSSRVQSQRF